MASRFEHDTALASLEPPGTFQATIDSSWWVPGGPNGGYLAAMLVRALRERLEDAGPLRSIHVAFVDRADPGPARVETTVQREGRSVTMAGVELAQGGPPLTVAQATFGRRRTGGRFVASDPPEVSSFDEGEELSQTDGLEPPTFTQHCEFRVVGGDPPLTGRPGGDMQVWMRLAEPAPYDEPLTVFLADAWMPAVYTALDEPVPAPSLDLTVQVNAIPGDLGAQDPLLGVFRAETAHEGYAFEDGELWTPEGELVARARQTRRLLDDRATG